MIPIETQSLQALTRNDALPKVKRQVGLRSMLFLSGGGGLAVGIDGTSNQSLLRAEAGYDLNRQYVVAKLAAIPHVSAD